MNDAAVCGFNPQKQKDSWWFRKRDLVCLLVSFDISLQKLFQREKN